MVDLSRFAAAFNDSPFEEDPVDLDTFLGLGYLAREPSQVLKLSQIQKDLVEHMTQIYTMDDLMRVYGANQGRIRYETYTKKEVIFQLGKGNYAVDQKFYSVDRGYVPASELGTHEWIADSRDEPRAALPFFSEGPSEIYRVTTKHGYSFDCGPNHKTPTWKPKHGKKYSVSKDPQMIDAIDLEKGDLVEIKLGWTECENPFDCTADEARLIGYMIGDGTYTKYSGRNPMFTNATKEVQDDFVRIVENMGGRLRYETSGAGCWRVSVAGLNHKFRDLGLVNNDGEEKSWDDRWLSMSHANMLEVVRGLIATDGWIYFSGPKPGYAKTDTCMIGVEMITQACTKGLHLMLAHLGILSKYAPHRPVRNEGKHSATYRTCITDSSYSKKLAEMLGWIPGKNDRVQKLLDMPVRGISKLSKYDRIESVEYLRTDEDSVCTTVAVEGVLNAGGIISLNSGKDYTATIGCAYIVYKLLCLKDPAAYFNKPHRDAIDIMNVAINAQQAKTVFFDNFIRRIENAPWFDGKYKALADKVSFDKSITVHSGHSERESHEGLNLILAILDEISGFNMTSNTANANAKTAEAIYNAFRASVASRFEIGKTVLLSFPRYKGDFISTHYDKMVTDKLVKRREHTFVIDPSRPATEDNTFKIEWDEDQILSYLVPSVYAVKAPSWEVNPTKDIEMYKEEFLLNRADAMQRFACMPEGIEGGLFKNPERIKECMAFRNPIDTQRRLDEAWTPDPSKTYYLHCDLAQKQDRAAVAVAHVESWTKLGTLMGTQLEVPRVVVDFVVWWTPQKGLPIDLADVAKWIIDFRSTGAKIGLVTTDRWNNVDFQRQLQSVGIRSDTLSVSRPEYDSLVAMVADNRVAMPDIELLYTELSQVMIINDRKVDHPRTGSKDLADAVAGAVHNAVSRTPVTNYTEVDIRDRSVLAYEHRKVKEPVNAPVSIENWLRKQGLL